MEKKVLDGLYQGNDDSYYVVITGNKWLQAETYAYKDEFDVEKRELHPSTYILYEGWEYEEALRIFNEAKLKYVK